MAEGSAGVSGFPTKGFVHAEADASCVIPRSIIACIRTSATCGRISSAKMK
jgi:hypothetical protein